MASVGQRSDAGKEGHVMRSRMAGVAILVPLRQPVSLAVARGQLQCLGPRALVVRTQPRILCGTPGMAEGDRSQCCVELHQHHNAAVRC